LMPRMNSACPTMCEPAEEIRVSVEGFIAPRAS
jgi:hypothetical protein